jgi:hypothetical protein
MGKKFQERRKYPRYTTDIKLYFRVHYSLKTKVKFQLINKDSDKFLSKKYFGISKDVSAEGLRFSSVKKLRKGNQLYLEMYLPRRREPVWMVGEVRWSKQLFSRSSSAHKYDTGVKLTEIMGERVCDSIYFDKKYKVFWGSVLNYAFGSFGRMKRKKVRKIKGAI